MNVKLFRVWHPQPIKNRISTWFCEFHTQNLLSQSWDKGGMRVKAICEQCLNLFIQAGRRKSEHTSNERLIR